MNAESHMARSRKSVLTSITSLEKRIREHEQKIKAALESNKNLFRIAHWEKEIHTFKQEIGDLKHKLKR